MEKKEMKGGVFNECLLMNIFPTRCPHGQGGRGSAKCRQLETGGGGVKNHWKCADILYGWPLDEIKTMIYIFICLRFRCSRIPFLNQSNKNTLSVIANLCQFHLFSWTHFFKKNWVAIPYALAEVWTSTNW